MKKISKEDKNYIDRMALWAANIKGRIGVFEFENKNMKKQIARNTQMVELEKEMLAGGLDSVNKNMEKQIARNTQMIELEKELLVGGLDSVNKWRESKGYLMVKSL